MLLLTRNCKTGKNTVVLTTGDGVKVRVVVRAIRGGQVSLGFDAPEEVTILREEVPDVYQR